MMTRFAQRRPALFQSVRSSRDLSLVAFFGALFVLAATQLAAFVPRLAPDAPPAAESARVVTERREPALVAARRAAVVAPAAAPHAAPAARTSLTPCDAPRG